MLESDLVMNGKQHSKQTEDYMSQQLCSLECAIPPATFQAMMDEYSRKESKAI